MFEEQAVTRGKWDEGKELKWRGVLEEQRQSGESVRAFCRGRGLKEVSFYRWRQVIQRRDREAMQAKSSTLAPVAVVEEQSDSGTNHSEPAAIEIVLHGGTVVRVPNGSTSEQLGMVLNVLGRSRC